MRYDNKITSLIESKTWRYDKGFVFLSFAENFGKVFSSKYKRENVKQKKSSATNIFKSDSK